MPAAQLRAPGELMEGKALTSGPYSLNMQSDGNLVLSQTGVAEPLFATKTSGEGGPYKLVMQNDGNLVVYGGGSTTDPMLHIFESGTRGSDAPPYVFIMQDDGNAVVYGATGPVWSTFNDINLALLSLPRNNIEYGLSVKSKGK